MDHNVCYCKAVLKLKPYSFSINLNFLFYLFFFWFIFPTFSLFIFTHKVYAPNSTIYCLNTTTVTTTKNLCYLYYYIFESLKVSSQAFALLPIYVLFFVCF